MADTSGSEGGCEASAACTSTPGGCSDVKDGREVTDMSEVIPESEVMQSTDPMEVDPDQGACASDASDASGKQPVEAEPERCVTEDGEGCFRGDASDDDDDAVPSSELFVGNRDEEDDIIQAVRANHCERVAQLVRSGRSCSDVCRWEGPPCTVRVERGDFRKQLQMTGYTALHVAVIHSSLQTIRCLLSLGAEVNIRDKNERTPLQLAVTVNRPTVARLLLDSGAEVNSRSVSGRSPLMEAVTNVSADLTAVLLGAGACADLPDIKGTTPLLGVVNAMGGGSAASGRGPAHREVLTKGLVILDSLIQAGCEVDRTNPAGASALMLAAGLKNTSAIHRLVAAGANINLADRAGRTAFDMATEGQRNLSAVKALMQYGAATNISDRKGQTPLSKALKFGSVAMLRLLLTADAVPHSPAILTAPRIVQLRQYLPEFDAYLLEELCQPRPLRRLCREAVRNALSPHNLPKVKDLGLPRTLNNYILGESD